ncbi:MAG: ABC transporter substrate-binding protein [Simkaniaceae bacterium]|nr:ABC transporter substrate-binding protein [Simkaniaceae bacterium]
MKKILITFFAFSLFFAVGCRSHQPRKVYFVAIDPTFYPMSFDAQLPYVLGFTNELLMEIADRRHIIIHHVPRSWDNIILDLKEKQYDAMLSGMDPILTNEKEYEFSNVYLSTGPVLVCQKEAPKRSLSEMKNAFIGVLPRTRSAFYVETQDNLMPHYYPSNGEMCFAVDQEQIDGALIGNIAAMAYVADLFEQKLAIMSEPMFNEGLRLVVLKGQHNDLIEEFNEGLKELKKKGIYQALLLKWHLSID